MQMMGRLVKLQKEAYASTFGLLSDSLICPHNALKNLEKVSKIKLVQFLVFRITSLNLLRCKKKDFCIHIVQPLRGVDGIEGTSILSGRRGYYQHQHK